MKNNVVYNLQIVRGIAAILVMLHHSTVLVSLRLFSGFFMPGWCGVDLFFIISGFIICYTNQNTINNLSTLKQYIWRRIVRIYPIYWASLFFILCSSYYLFPYNRAVDPFDLPLFIKSFFLWPTYLDVLFINPVSWTLSHEVFFYILFGIGMVIGKRFFLFLLFIWIIVILSFFKTPPKDAFLYMITNSKNIEFMYGCVLSLYINKLNFTKKIYLFVLCAGVIFFIISWFYIWQNNLLHDKFDFMLLGIQLTLIVYSIIKLENNYKNKLITILIFIGDASYSIYLTHFMTIFYLNYFLSDIISVKTVRFALINITCIIIGCLFYLFLEKPLISFFRKHRNYYTLSTIEN